MFIQIQFCQGAKSWPAYVQKNSITIVEALNQSKDPLTHRARILINGLWMTTNHSVQEVLDLIKET